MGCIEPGEFLSPSVGARRKLVRRLGITIIELLDKPGRGRVPERQWRMIILCPVCFKRKPVSIREKEPRADETVTWERCPKHCADGEGENISDRAMKALEWL